MTKQYYLLFDGLHINNKCLLLFFQDKIQAFVKRPHHGQNKSLMRNELNDSFVDPVRVRYHSSMKLLIKTQCRYFCLIRQSTGIGWVETITTCL